MTKPAFETILWSWRQKGRLKAPGPLSFTEGADLPSKQQCAAASAVDTAHVSSLSLRSCGFHAAEGVPAATSACLRVLGQILSSASPAAAAAGVPRKQNTAQCVTQPAGRDKTCCDESVNIGPYGQNATEIEVSCNTEQPKRSRHDGIIEVDRTSVAADDDVTRSERRDGETDITEGTQKDSEARHLRRVESFVSIFKLLHSAGVLDTLPKCFHMLHAVCILADQQKQICSAAATFDPASPPGVPFSPPKKRKIFTGGCTVVETLRDAAQSTECDDHCSRTCSPNTNSVGIQEQGQTAYQSAAPLSADYRLEEHEGSAEEIIFNIYAKSSLSSEVDAGLSTTDCERHAAVCCSEGAQTQHFSGDRQELIPLPLYRQARTSQVAGLLLGYIEALEAPPPLSDPRFHEKVLHVLCHVLYTRHPLEQKYIRACGVSTLTPAMKGGVGNSSAANDDNGVYTKKIASSTEGTTSQLLDAYNERQHGDWTAPNGGIAMTSRASPEEWRRHIVIRFDIVERLLLCSVPALFLRDTAHATAEETSGTAATNANIDGGHVSAAVGECEAAKRLFADSVNFGAYAADNGDGKGVAARERESNRDGTDKPGWPARSALNTAASTAALIQGRERCRRALRMVRRWVAFLLELEHERQTVCERVLQASEEVHGLPHMLLQGRRQQEQAQQLSLKDGGNSCLSASRSKRRCLLSLGIPPENDPMPDHYKHGSAKEAAWNGGGAEETSEELETRIRATQQLLLLPSIPPFTCPELETVQSARTRFERCLSRWREAQGRRRQEEEEARRKSAAAAAAVVYVTERMQEQQQAQAVVYSTPPGTAAAATALLRLRSISHAFYLLGLNPQTATFQMVEQVKKKWRVLLHPDKFVSTHSHLLQQATEAFKAFHLAVTEATRLLAQRRIEPSWAPPPPPPDLTTRIHSGAAVTASERGAGTVRQQASSESLQPPGKNFAGTATAASAATAATASCGGNPGTETLTSCCPVPTHQYFPDVIVQVSRSKKKASVGGLTIQVHGSPSREGEWPFAVIKEIRIFVLRPTLSERHAWKLVPSSADLCLLVTKTVELKCTCPALTRECSALSTTADVSSVCSAIKVEIDALQPFELGVEKVYWVGTQVEGLHKSQSLITWKRVTVCLALPEGAENGVSPHLDDSGRPSALDEDAAGSDAHVNCTDTPATNRALLAFLQTFTAEAFVKKDCSFNGRLQDAITSLKRVLRHRKKCKKSQQPRVYGQDIEECKWVRNEAMHVLQECMERGRTWKSEADKGTVPGAMG